MHISAHDTISCMYVVPGEGCGDAPSTSKSEATTSWGLTVPSERINAQQAADAAAAQSGTLSGDTTAKKDTELLYIQMEYCPQTLHTVLDSGTLLYSVTLHSACCTRERMYCN